MPLLSIIIPARNEEFLQETIDDILKNSTEDTEVIAILDGYTEEFEGFTYIEKHSKVTVIKNEKSIGQRASTNKGIKASQAKYIMKLDAHCAMAPGFDTELIKNCEKNWTVIPRMYVLDAFHWICDSCGKEYGQGAKIQKCADCPGTEFTRKMIWLPKLKKVSDYMWFDKELRIKYFDSNGLMPYGDNIKQLKKMYSHSQRVFAGGDITDVMCGIGACWFMHRDYYNELGGLDEAHGSWGQMAVEIACKTWLSGGRHVVNKNTWFAHLPRTQPGFSWPYEMKAHDQEKAREYSRDLWLNNKWDKAKLPFQWLINKFSPLPGWQARYDTRVLNNDNDLTVVYYTANKVPEGFSEKVKDQLKHACNGYPIIAVSQEPINNFGKNIVVGDIGQSLENVYKQILIGAREADTEYIACAEDDTLYVPEHFKHRPIDAPFIYNMNRWNLHENSYSYRKRPVMGMCIANRKELIECLENRFKLHEIPKKYCGEVGVFEKKLGLPEYSYTTFQTAEPNVVVCHENNTTGHKLIGKDAEPRKELAPWGEATDLLQRLTLKENLMAKFGRGSKNRTQHSYIGSIIFGMDEIMSELLDYTDRRRPERGKQRMEVIPPFITKIADKNPDYVFTNEELLSDPYYNYLTQLLNPADKLPVVSEKGKRHCIALMRELQRLYHDIRVNGLKSPLDMWREGKRFVLHRGWRRLLIMNELHKRGLRNFARVPVRIFKSKEIFRRYNPSAAWTSGEVKGDSIHSLAMKQFADIGTHATDKYWVHGYTQYYDMHLSHLREKKLKILEIGVFRGASLLLWKHAFPNSMIYGIDKNTAIWKEMLRGQKRIKVFVGRQEDERFLKETVIPNGKYDVIIDDGGHTPEEQLATFKNLWPHVNNNGFFVIEDLHGNYWDRRAKNGPLMMEKIKSMIDDVVGTNEIYEIKSISAYYNIVFIGKN